MEDRVRPKAVAKGSVGVMQWRKVLTAEEQYKSSCVDDGLGQEARVVPVAGVRYQMEVHVGLSRGHRVRNETETAGTR